MMRPSAEAQKTEATRPQQTVKQPSHRIIYFCAMLSGESKSESWKPS
jgi:hypothetical protein